MWNIFQQDDEEMEEEEDRQKLLMDARVFLVSYLFFMDARVFLVSYFHVLVFLLFNFLLLLF